MLWKEVLSYHPVQTKPHRARRTQIWVFLNQVIMPGKCPGRLMASRKGGRGCLFQCCLSHSLSLHIREQLERCNEKADVLIPRNFSALSWLTTNFRIRSSNTRNGFQQKSLTLTQPSWRGFLKVISNLAFWQENAGLERPTYREKVLYSQIWL